MNKTLAGVAALMASRGPDDRYIETQLEDLYDHYTVTDHDLMEIAYRRGFQQAALLLANYGRAQDELSLRETLITETISTPEGPSEGVR